MGRKFTIDAPVDVRRDGRFQKSFKNGCEAAFRSRQNSRGLPKPWCDVHDHRMPELPDIVAYITALESRIVGQQLIRVRVASTFLLRSTQPPIREVEGRVVRELRRIGKRIAIGL